MSVVPRNACRLRVTPFTATSRGRRRPWLPLVAGALGALIALSLGYAFWNMAAALFADTSQAANPLKEAFELRGLPEVLRNTAVLVVLGGGGAMLVGSLLAWLNERTDAHMGWFSSILPVVGLLVPPVAAAIGWVMLLSPRAGLVNAALRGLFGSSSTEGPFNIFSWPGLVFLYALELTPFVYVVMSASLRNLDAALEEASRIGGAGPLETLRRVTLPSIKPAIASSALLTVTVGLALFSVPSIVGGGARVPVLSTTILDLLRGQFPPRTSVAVVLSGIMLTVILVCWALQAWVVRNARSASVGGKGVSARRLSLGAWRTPARICVLLFIALSTALPLTGLALVSFQQFWSAKYRFDRLSLANFRTAFIENEVTQAAIVNSLALGLSAATVGMTIAWLLALNNQMNRSLYGRAIDAVVKLPAGISHIVMGVALLLAYAGAPFYLSGTLTILLLAYVLAYLPQGSIASASAVSQVHKSLLEASRISGAGEWRTLRRVSLPLMLPAVAGGWAMMFVFSLGDLTLSVLLSSVASPTAGYMLLDLYDTGTFPLIAALSLTLTVISAAVVLSVLRLASGRRRGGRAPAAFRQLPLDGSDPHGQGR